MHTYASYEAEAADCSFLMRASNFSSVNVKSALKVLPFIPPNDSNALICMHVCIYVCIYIYTYIHTYIYIYMYTHTHTHTHIYIYTHTWALTPLVFIPSNDCNALLSRSMYVCMYVCTFMYVRVYIHTYIRTYMHAYTCIHITYTHYVHTYIHAHTCIHLHIYKLRT